MLFCFKESTAIGYRHCGFISFWIPWLGCTQCWVSLRLSLPSILFVIPFRSLHVRRHWRWAETWGLWEGKFHPDDRFWCLHSSSRGKAAVPPCNCQPPHCQWPSLDLTQLFFLWLFFSIAWPNRTLSIVVMDDPAITRDLVEQHITRLLSQDAMDNIPDWNQQFLVVVNVVVAELNGRGHWRCKATSMCRVPSQWQNQWLS